MLFASSSKSFSINTNLFIIGVLNFQDTDDYDTDDPGILGVFEPNGKASCYFKDGSLRYCFNLHHNSLVHGGTKLLIT